jgi:hypothetical protein
MHGFVEKRNLPRVVLLVIPKPISAQTVTSNALHLVDGTRHVFAARLSMSSEKIMPR